MQTDRRGGWRRGCAIAAIIGCAVVALAILGGYLYDRAWELRVEAKLQEYRDAGQPVTWEEVLATRPQIPDDENAALILLQAFDLLEELETPADEFLQRVNRSEGRLGWRNSEAMLDLARTRTEALAEVLRLIQEAALLEAAVYPLDASVPPWERDLHYLSFIRDAAWLLQVRAVVHAQEGRPAEAAAVLLGWSAMPASLDAGITLIEALVRADVGEIWAAGIEETLALCELTPAALHALRERIAREDEQLSLALVFYGERAMGRWMFGQETLAWLASPHHPKEAAFWRRYVMVPTLKERSALLYYESLTRAAALADEPLPERLRRAQGLDQESAEIIGKSPQAHLLFASIAPNIGGAYRGEARSHAQLRVAGAALAVEEWRMAHGAWPESLDALVPEMLEAIPEDPFTGEPLRYRRQEEGVIVYSIGLDETDDAGVAYDEAQKKAGEYVEEGWDIAFRLLNTDLRGEQTMTFRDEIMGSFLRLEELEEVGFPRERLLELGLTEADLVVLEGRGRRHQAR